jgi:hypothetical protein
MNRTIVIFFIVLAVLAFGFYYYRHLVFTGTFDKKYTREELTQNFIQHENEFADLVTYFNSKVPNDKKQRVSFGLSKGNKVSLIIYPTVIDPANKIIEKENLELGSPELDSALTILGWTNETAKVLKDKLSKTNCDWIRTTEVYGNPIEVYNNQSGWGSFSYRVFEMPLSDSLIQIHGKAISNSEFGKRVVLDYSSAL